MIDLDALTPAEQRKLERALRKLPPGMAAHAIDWEAILAAIRGAPEPSAEPSPATVGDLVAGMEWERARRRTQIFGELNGKLDKIGERLRSGRPRKPLTGIDLERVHERQRESAAAFAEAERLDALGKLSARDALRLRIARKIAALSISPEPEREFQHAADARPDVPNESGDAPSGARVPLPRVRSAAWRSG